MATTTATKKLPRLDKSAEGKSHFYDIISHFSEAMLTTYGIDGKLHTRPMSIIKVDRDEGIYFFTSWSSPKIEEIRAQTQCAVSMQQEKRWLTLSGQAGLIDDREKIKELWDESIRPYFPGGPESSEIVLVKVIPEVGEHWDASGAFNRLTYAFEMGRAYMTGTHAEPQRGADWNKVDLVKNVPEGISS